jgi:sulfur relay (sulfurtransferase) DsrF/TusC family protein
MAKNIAVIIRHSPLNTIRSVEAFRLGIGLTLEGNRVDLFLMENGAWNALSISPNSLQRPDVDQFIQSMELCGVKGYVDSIELPPTYLLQIRKEFQIRSKEEMFRIIRQADVVIPF